MLLSCSVGEDSWESLANKEIEPVNPKGNQSWIFTRRTDAETGTPTLATWCEELTHWKRPWCWESLKAWDKGDNRAWELVMDMSLSQLWELVINSWLWKPGVCSPWGLKDSDMTEWLNWTELMAYLTWYPKLTNAMVAYFSPTMHNYKCAGVEGTETFIQAKLMFYQVIKTERVPRE